MALIFGATGSDLIGIAESLRSSEIQISLVEVSAALMLIALCFKVAVAPFHIWTPDVYEGAPTPVSLHVRRAQSRRVCRPVPGFPDGVSPIQDRWASAFWLIAALTMVLGNVIAVVPEHQAHARLFFDRMRDVAVAFAASDHGVSAALFYLLAYSLMNLGAFRNSLVLGRVKTNW